MNAWQSIALGLALFGAGYGVKGMAEARRAAAVSVALQTQLLDYNSQAIEATRAEAERIIAAVSERNPQREAQAQLVDQILKEVRLAPSTNTCLSSPAVRVAIDRLRELEASRPDREPT